MSGRSPASVEMIVINTPSQDLVKTNFAYCSVGDFRRFSIPGTNPTQVLVGDSVVLPIHSHNSISDLQIGLNAIQRRHIKISAGDKVSVGRFLPPDDFSLALLTVELNYVKAKSNINEELDAIVLAQHLRKTFHNQIMTSGQKVLFEFLGINYVLTVNRAVVEGLENSNDVERGQITNDTHIIFDAVSNSGIKINNQNEAATSNIFKQNKFNLQELGIGGLNEEFIVILRRTFASRIFPPHVINKLGIKHVKGMLLYGPPGTGKTLLARQIGKLLNGREPKVVNGPEVLSKFVGETEKNVRDLFADAEQDQRARGNQSDLHIIIFDEIDAICKTRGSMRDGTGVHDGIVNQLLTKIDGVESLDNVLLIGMTNRKDLLDEALLRPGRLEVHVEINLPDENGRLQILQIHTHKLKENSYLAPDVNLLELAARTKNFSGAEIEGLVKSSVSFALNRQLNMNDLTKPLDEGSIRVTMNDFLTGLSEIIPAFGASIDELHRCRLYGIIECGEMHKHIYGDIMSRVEHVKTRKDNPLLTCLLEGSGGSGKTSIAATVGIDSNLAYVKIISEESMVGLNESSKCAKLSKVFEDAYKSEMSIIILDDIESLLEYGAIGSRYSSLILRTLKVFLRKLPPKGKNMLVIGTTSEAEFLDTLGICRIFSKIYHVPTLTKENAREVLQRLDVFALDDIDAAAEVFHGKPLKELFLHVDLAAGRASGKNLKDLAGDDEKIDINYLYSVMS